MDITFMRSGCIPMLMEREAWNVCGLRVRGHDDLEGHAGLDGGAINACTCASNACDVASNASDEIGHGP